MEDSYAFVASHCMPSTRANFPITLADVAWAHCRGASKKFAMHILITTDTLSEVWIHTRELATELTSRGVRVTLVSFGDIPVPDSVAWMHDLPDFSYHPTAFRLDWMQEGERDFPDAYSYLTAFIKEVRPDIVHVNHLRFGSLQTGVPCVAAAHGDYISWWQAVHGREPKVSSWLHTYRDDIRRGLQQADVVVASSEWLQNTLEENYCGLRCAEIIHNGRNPIYFNPYLSKQNSVLAAGRTLDLSKGIDLLTRHPHDLPIQIAGSEMPPVQAHSPIRTDLRLALAEAQVSFKGAQTEAQMRMLFSRSSIYAATARYDASGAGTLEAALSRCAIVANDITVHRELWGGAALYFETNRSDSLAECIHTLGQDTEMCREFGNRAYQRARERFTARRMANEYLTLYRRLAYGNRAAA